MKKIILVSMIMSSMLWLNHSHAEKTPDSFQQFANYLLTGNPFKSETGGFVAEIFDRANCISGYVDPKGGDVKYYWNNVDVNSISFQEKFADGVWQVYMEFSGHPYVADINIEHELLRISYSAKGILNGRHSTISLPMGRLTSNHIERYTKSFQMLYSKHCTGLKQKSAF